MRRAYLQSKYANGLGISITNRLDSIRGWEVHSMKDCVTNQNILLFNNHNNFFLYSATHVLLCYSFYGRYSNTIVQLAVEVYVLSRTQCFGI